MRITALIQRWGLLRIFALSGFVSIIGISIVSGYIYFSFLQQNRLAREMAVSSGFIQSVSLINNPQAYFEGGTNIEDKRAWMIKTFADNHTQRLFEGESPRRFRAFQRQTERKLQMLDAAATLDFLRNPPGNRLEALSGNRKGQHSIRSNQQWRLCFRWHNGDAFDVEITDYH